MRKSKPKLKIKPKLPAQTNRRPQITRKSIFIKKKQDPLAEVQKAAETFNELCKSYAEAAEGYRTGLYKFAARCYWIARTFTRKPEMFERFMRDAFWSDVRQKPKSGETVKAVLTFAMKAKSANLRNRVTKTVAVLKSLDELDLKAEHVVVSRLRAGGGIEKMYREVSGKKSGSALPDDLDLLKPDSPDAGEDVGDEGDDAGEPVPGSTDNEADEWWSGGSRGDGETSADDDPSGEAPQRSAANKSGLKPSKKVGEGSQSQPRFRRFDSDKHLAVELDEHDLTWVLRSPQRIVIEIEVGDEDETGWRTVKALSVERTPWIDFPSSKPETDDDND